MTSKSVSTTSKTASAQVDKRGAGIAKSPEDENAYGIKNQFGILTEAHIHRMVSYYLVGPLFRNNRKENLAHFLSDEFLSQYKGATIVELAYAIQSSPKWLEADRSAVKAPRKIKAPKVPAEFGKLEFDSTDPAVLLPLLQNSTDMLEYGLSVYLANAAGLDLLTARNMVIAYLDSLGK